MTERGVFQQLTKVNGKRLLLWIGTLIALFLFVRLIFLLFRFGRWVIEGTTNGEIFDRLSMISPMSIAINIALFVLIATIFTVLDRLSKKEAANGNESQ